MVVETVIDSLTENARFENEDQKFWWYATAISLSRLLAVCKYNEERRHQLLSWYRRFILPALGPRPIRGVKPNFEPCLVFDGSACELSMNWKELDPHRTVRFTIEATGSRAGTSADPFNQDETTALLRSMSEALPDLDLTQFEHFAAAFFLPGDAADNLAAKLPADTPLSQVWVAFDLLRDHVMAKVYFIPLLKWIHTGTPTRKLVREAVVQCNSKFGGYDASFAVLDSFLDSFPPSEAPHIEMVAIDCNDTPSSRVKIYLRTAVNTLTKAREAYTLGGRLCGQDVAAAIEALDEFWPIIFRLKGPNSEEKEVFEDGSGCGYAIEMKPGATEPEVKIHIPVRKIDGSDKQICESLSAWFKKRGNMKLATTYKEELEGVLYVVSRAMKKLALIGSQSRP